MKFNFNKQKNTFFLTFFYLVVFLVGLINYQEFGIHIEEKFHRLNGLYWLSHISNTFNLVDLQNVAETKINQISDYTLSPVSKYNKYGIVLDLPVAFFEVLFNLQTPKEIYYLKHLLSFTIFLISSIFLFKILFERFQNFFLSFFGIFLYLSSPRILGDSFLYKDVLYLSCFTITLFFFIKSLKSFGYRNFIFFSLFTAVSINLRIFSILIPFLFVFMMILKNFYKKNFKNDLIKIINYFLLSFVFLYILWPYLWLNPITNFLDLFSSLKNDLVNVKILYGNSFFSNRTLPDTYILNWIIISSPPLQTILFLFGYLICLYRLGKRYLNLESDTIYNDLWRGRREETDFIFFIFLTSFYLLFIITNAPLYNGWRLVYFFNTLIIYFSVFFLNILISKFRKNKIIFYSFFCIAIISMFSNILAIFNSHPFQSIYFNAFARENANEYYEGDYHGLSTKHFFEKILLIDKNNLIKVAVASHTPIQRGLEALPDDLKKKFKIIGQEYQNADYIYKNNISEVDIRLNKKYEVPKNFSKIYELKVNKTVIYEIYEYNGKIR